MNTQQQAYLDGFVKRANQHGLNSAEALKLFKQAAPPVATVAPLATPAEPAKQNLFNKARNWISKKTPGYPTSVGATSGGVDELVKRFQEQAGG